MLAKLVHRRMYIKLFPLSCMIFLTANADRRAVSFTLAEKGREGGREGGGREDP